MISHFENLFSNFFHTENMASNNSSSVEREALTSVEAHPESVYSIYESPIFLNFGKDQQEMIKQANVESFDSETVKTIIAEITERESIKKLKFTEEEAWDLIEFFIFGVQSVQHMPIEKFIDIYTKGKTLNKVKNSLYNEIIERMKPSEYFEKLAPQIVQVRVSSEFHKTKDKYYMNNFGHPSSFISNFLICVFKLIEKDQYYIFVPMKWFMRDKSQFIPFSVTAYNFSIFGDKKYTKIDKSFTFRIGDQQYYFGSMNYYKSQKGEMAVKVRCILNAPAQAYFRDIASKITDEDKFKELLGTPLDDAKARKQTMEEFEDLIPNETFESFQKYDVVD